MASRAPEYDNDQLAPRTHFSAAELAELALPGMPADKRGIARRAQEERWATRTGTDGAMLVRPRAGRGGGTEFHVLLLPPQARLALARRGLTGDRPSPVAVDPDIGGWRWYDAQSDSVRAEAKERLAIVGEIELLKESGMTWTAAVADVAARHDVSPATLHAWRALIKGMKPENRLPALAPRRKGGGREAEIDPALWTILLSDYLRPEKPTFSSCYDRLIKIAKARSLELPHKRTLQRKIERETNRLVVVQRRNGAEALRHTLPPQKRSVAGLHALELVNIDGHRWDVFARWPDGTVARPVMVAIQCVYSRKMLAWSIGRTESAIETRLALARLFQNYGIPRGILLDNGRAFASKWITGGAKTRFRFKIREEEPLGIITALGITSHWAQPYRGQSKPIERAFRDFCDRIAKHPAFHGAYVGNKPDAKPENYGSNSVPIDRFIEMVEAGIRDHNAAPGRKTEMGRGVYSFDQVYAASAAVSPIGKATPEQLRLALLAADDRPTDRNSGEIRLHENRYWAPELAQVAGERVIVRFDPDDLHAPIHVYHRTGEYLCEAPVFDATGFLDAAAAKRRKRLEKDLSSSVKAMIVAEDLLEADQLAGMYPANPFDDAPIDTPVILPVRHRGQTAAALKTTSQRQLNAVRTVSDPSLHDDLLAGVSRLRAVE